MINPERLLGGMIKQGLRSGKRRKRGGLGLDMLMGSGWKAAAGIGALGVAIAAFEHFTQKSGTPPAHGAGAAPGTSGMAPPPAPSAGPPSGPGSTPPSAPPGPPPVGTAGEAVTGSKPISESDALLLLRAMIAAANADGEIDTAERGAILSRLEEAGMSGEERAFILEELENPASIDSILPKIGSPELASQVYAVSLLAIEVDTKAERDYLAYLRMRLDLNPDAVSELHRQLGLEPANS